MLDRELVSAEVVFHAPFTIRVLWGNSEHVTVDLSGLIACDPTYSAFTQNPSAFHDLTISDGEMRWGNGLKMTSESLRLMAEEQRSGSDAELLEQLQSRHQLTNGQLAHALGYQESQIKNFKAGRAKMSHSVLVTIRAMLRDPHILYARMGFSAMKLGRRR
ncbi:hypothetical protein ACFOY8_12030 [Thalassospira xianhensis]|uniref:DUF2442 domain-containing protein n=1 Tax=Thalassospira xianhensis MCCC 1A02616 TaxID=1177929 RepID=A0A367U780_9PROT|nr:hypothetical protein [Thalassospira xianhensis]RCK04157.1 hypothetical protein TH5_21525 [Thalassospira xianhensis MCCC 1A02616]